MEATATINDLINEIYMENESHIEFIWNMGGGDCDCNIHTTLNLICTYIGWNPIKEEELENA